jgi:rod shape-determining protein MreC
LNARFGVLLGVLFIASLLMTRFMPPAPVALSSGIAPLTQVLHRIALNTRNAFSFLVLERELGVRTRQQEGRIAELEAQNARHQAYIRELEQAANLRKSISPAIVTSASVISVDSSPLLSRLTIDKGANDGVSERMPVIANERLVGLVMEVSRTKAVVWTLVDPYSRVGVSVTGRGGRGVAHGVPPGMLRADNYTRDAKVQPGDIVTSSNALGSVFPLVTVGTVDRVLPASSNSIGQTIFIRPAIDVNAVETVFVVRTS